jgi:hypothetical protein
MLIIMKTLKMYWEGKYCEVNLQITNGTYNPRTKNDAIIWKKAITLIVSQCIMVIKTSKAFIIRTLHVNYHLNLSLLNNILVWQSVDAIFVLICDLYVYRDSDTEISACSVWALSQNFPSGNLTCSALYKFDLREVFWHAALRWNKSNCLYDILQNRSYAVLAFIFKTITK